MNILEKLLSPLLLKTGKYAFVVAMLLVFFNYWDVIQLDKITGFVEFLHVYVLLNAFAAARLIYREKKARVSVDSICPQCKQSLETSVNYTCPNCGHLEFKKQD